MILAAVLTLAFLRGIRPDASAVPAAEPAARPAQELTAARS